MARILIWAEHLWPIPGGAELIALLLSTGLQERGHEIEVLTSRLPGAPEDEVVSGLQVRRITTVQPQATASQVEIVAAGLARARQVVARFQPELMLLIQPLTMLMFYAATRRLFPVPSIFSLHAHLEAEWSADQLTGRLIRASDYVTSCSEVVLTAVRQHMPEIVGKSEAIVNALPPPELASVPLPWDAPRFLCLGRLVYEKDFSTALRAFARIAPQYPAARLVVSGEGPERAALGGLAAALGIAAQVDFTGWIPQAEVYAALNRATALLAPSVSEGLPLTGLQAMQMGRPMIAASTDGLLELIVDGETGFLFEPGDDAAMAERLTRLLGDRAGAAAMRQAALHRAQTVFDWETHVERYDRLARRLVDQSAFRVGQNRIN